MIRNRRLEQLLELQCPPAPCPRCTGHLSQTALLGDLWLRMHFCLRLVELVLELADSQQPIANAYHQFQYQNSLFAPANLASNHKPSISCISVPEAHTPRPPPTAPVAVPRSLPGDGTCGDGRRPRRCQRPSRPGDARPAPRLAQDEEEGGSWGVRFLRMSQVLLLVACGFGEPFSQSFNLFLELVVEL